MSSRDGTSRGRHRRAGRIVKAVVLLLTAAAAGTGLTAATVAVSSGITASVSARSGTGSAPEGPVATSRAYDVVTVSTERVHVHSPSCRSVPFAVRYRSPQDPDHGFTADMEVWRGRSYQDRVFVYARHRDSTAGVLTAGQRYYWCPDQGLGDFRVGPSRVSGKSYTGTTSPVSFDDDTAGRLQLRGDSRTTLQVSRVRTAPGRVRVAAAVTWYSPRAARFRRWPAQPVRLVRLERHVGRGSGRGSGPGWTVVAVARTDSGGVARATLAAPAGTRLRARFVGTPYFWASLSAVRAVSR